MLSAGMLIAPWFSHPSKESEELFSSFPSSQNLLLSLVPLFFLGLPFRPLPLPVFIVLVWFYGDRSSGFWGSSEVTTLTLVWTWDSLFNDPSFLSTLVIHRDS
jgi:hypothetical protein